MWSRSRNETDSDWFFRNISKHPRFAHHPTCECFDDHLIRFGKRAVCLGCFCLGAGMIAAGTILVMLHVRSRVPAPLNHLWSIWLTGLLLYAPALAQPFWQNKLAKIVFRTALGVSIVLLWYGAIVAIPWDLPGLAYKLGFVLVFSWTFRLTLRFRERHTDNPLANCDRGCYPLCEGNRSHLETLLQKVRQRCGETDPEFVRFAEGFINGDDTIVEIEHIIPR